jgi:hypothetical protein
MFARIRCIFSSMLRSASTGQSNSHLQVAYRFQPLEQRCLLSAPYIADYTAWGPEIGEGDYLSPGYEYNSAGFTATFADDDFDSIASVIITWPDGSTPEVFDNIQNNTLEASHFFENVSQNSPYLPGVGFEIVDSASEVGYDNRDLPIFNAPPTGTMNSTGPINEGTSVTVSITDPVDPSPIDTAAGFRYAFGDNPALLPTTYNGTGTSANNQASFYYPDNVPYSTIYGGT